MRLLLTLQYLGTRYAGWQLQTNALAIQQLVEEALARTYGTTVRLEAAGRTDAGVHALAQRAHADVPFAIAPRGLVLGLNNLLPPDIRVTGAEEVPETFHCRFAPHRKSYAYRIWNGPCADVFHAETHAYVAGRLDTEAMHAAALALTGSHDFKAFTVASPEVSSTVRTVDAASVEREGRVVTFRITADGFLRFMVRRMAGSLIEIGRGKLPAEALGRSLEPEHAEARWTAPAKGLRLESIVYL
jgi:tRNA pseudouridine38-40 synthase